MTVPRLSYRRMKVADVDQVLRTENQVYAFPWTEAIIKDCIRVGYECWLALEYDEVIAHAVISVAAGESHLLNLSVATEHQGKGVGNQFTKFLIDIARNRRAKTMLLEVRASNLAAINCYNACGFNEIGSRKDYYPATKGKEDALLFALEIA